MFWRPDEPNERPATCARYVISERDDRWRDRPCTRTYRFLCELPN